MVYCGVQSIVVWGTDLSHPLPYGESNSQSEISSSFRRLLALRGSVARASLMDELGVHPHQVHWLKACVTCLLGSMC
jgi:hypothetical protein